MIPMTSQPPRILRIVTALITLLMPGAGPPPTKMPTIGRGEVHDVRTPVMLNPVTAQVFRLKAED